MNFVISFFGWIFSVNTAFAMLRTLIPTEPADRKLSKIETLRLACSYISHLGTLLVAGKLIIRFKIEIKKKCNRNNFLLGSCDKAGLAGEEELKFRQRPQVCTFCVALLKKPKGIGRDLP